MNSQTPASFLAAPGDLWGIPGRTFLTWYLVAAAVVIVLAVYAVVSGFTGPVDAPTGQLPPEEVGYLAGGRRQAYLTALTALRAQGLVTGAGRGRIVATPRYGQPLSDLQLAIVEATAAGTRTTVVPADGRVRAALDDIRRTLQQRGLMAGPGRIRILRLVPRLVVVLLLIGLFRLASGFLLAHPSGDLKLTMVALAVVGVIVRVAGRARTAAGTALIKRLRADNEHLRESANPSWATYGAMGAGLSVALFGADLLFTFDPAFAAEAAIPRYAGSGSLGMDSSSYSSFSGWSDGGSMGSGGSDGSGSSCGGGSGCGGGSSGGGGCGG